MFSLSTDELMTYISDAHIAQSIAVLPSCYNRKSNWRLPDITVCEGLLCPPLGVGLEGM